MRPFSGFRVQPIEVRFRGEADIRAGPQDRRLRAHLCRPLVAVHIPKADLFLRLSGAASSPVDDYYPNRSNAEVQSRPGRVPSRMLLEIAGSVFGAMTAPPQAARPIKLLAGG